MRTIAVSAVFIATMTLGGVTVASATFDSVWGEWVTWAEVPERTDSTAVSVDDGACVTVDLIYACEGEEGDYAAIRLVPPAYPYHVQQVGYVLRHGAVPLTTSLMCDAGLAHDVVFFVGDATSYPDASPVEIERLTVPADSGSQPARWVHVQPSNPIKLSAGEALFVSVEMVASVSGGERYKEIGDPVGALDFGAKSSRPGGWNPHSYARLGKDQVRDVTDESQGIGLDSYMVDGIEHAYR